MRAGPGRPFTGEHGTFRCSLPADMSENTELLNPSPEVQQLAMLGQIEDAIKLYAKQAEVDEETARKVVEPLGEI